MARSRGTARALSFFAALAAAGLLVVPIGEARAGAPAESKRVRSAVAATRVQPDAWIAAEAEYLSGRKLTVVCATTAPEWARALAAVGLPAADADRYYGFSVIVRGQMHLSPYVCEGLRLGKVASTRRQNELQVAWSVNVLVHESVHMARVTADEALTEACARLALPVELHRLYGLAYRSAELSRLTLAATWFRRTQGPAYQGGTCPAAG